MSTLDDLSRRMTRIEEHFEKVFARIDARTDDEHRCDTCIHACGEERLVNSKMGLVMCFALYGGADALQAYGLSDLPCILWEADPSKVKEPSDG